MCRVSAPVACGNDLTIQQSNSPTGICVLDGRETTWYRGTSFETVSDSLGGGTLIAPPFSDFLCQISHKGREERKEGKAVSDLKYSNLEVIT